MLQQTGLVGASHHDGTLVPPHDPRFSHQKEGGHENLKYLTIDKSEEMELKCSLTIGLHEVPVEDIPGQIFHPSPGLLHVILLKIKLIRQS